jgi:hypothetical protein
VTKSPKVGPLLIFSISLRAGVLGGGGDGDSYCDSEASLDGSCYDQLEDPLSPPPDVPQTLDLRHAHHEASFWRFKGTVQRDGLGLILVLYWILYWTSVMLIMRRVLHCLRFKGIV